ncbi:glycosyltransferase family 4 protein [Patescibacteria group bacterium]|nr:glycosyltransferase family 4 protein [Patescibacteria group bacterium]MBU2260142.1 glycosyltransferase family 4 protein [Patescibacteria group bacterium]
MSIHSLMFGWEYPPNHLGGLGVACQGIVRGLAKHNVHMTLVLPYAGEDEDAEVLSAGEEQLVCKARVRSLLTPYQTAEGYALKSQTIPRDQLQIYGMDMAEAIAQYTEVSMEITKDTNPDVIHCHDWMTYESGIRSANHHRKPLVTHIHATELDRTHFQPNEWIYARERRGFQAADRIIAVSNYTRSILTKHYGIDPAKISVVHNGSVYEPRQDLILTSGYRGGHHPMVLFLGRLVIQKGAKQFLYMATKVHALRPDVQFVVAGDGGQMGELIEQACDYGLQDCVIFAGKAHSHEVQKLYEQANCFVMPSLSEPFGLVALEAIAHGTPVVLSKQSGVVEVVDHCFTVDFWDTEKMADCVLTILRDEPLAMQLRSEAPHILRNLTWEKQAGHIYSIYKELIT